MHRVDVVASRSGFKSLISKDAAAQVVERSERSISEIDRPPAGAPPHSFQSAVPPLSPRRRCFPHRKQRHPKVGPPRTRGRFTMLHDFSRPIEEVCGRARTYLSVSGFALRITTAGRDGKTHRDGNRKRHVVLLPHFGRGIKACGDILVLAVCRRSRTTLPGLELARLSSRDICLSTDFYLLEV